MAQANLLYPQDHVLKNSDRVHLLNVTATEDVIITIQLRPSGWQLSKRVKCLENHVPKPLRLAP